MTAISRPVGRPRRAELDAAILEATLGEYGAHGFDAMSIDGVAARAGVGKATVYRRWGSKLELVAAALEHVGQQKGIPATGSLAGDVDAILHHLASLTRDPVHGASLRHIVGDGVRNPALAQVYADFVRGRRAITIGLLQQAVDRGEMRADTDLELAADLLAGPVFNRHLITHQPVDDAFLLGLQAAFVGAVAVAG